MLSHLRFHRRAPSNPTSPLPDQLSQWESAPVHEHPQTTQDVNPLPDMRPRESNATNTPPMLPPITRVTSEPDYSSASAFERNVAIDQQQQQQQGQPQPQQHQHHQQQQQQQQQQQYPNQWQQPQPQQQPQRPLASEPRDSKSPPAPRPPIAYGERDSSGFIGGVALENYRRGLQNGAAHSGSGSGLGLGLGPGMGGGHEAAPLSVPAATASGGGGGALPGTAIVRSKPPPPPINTGLFDRPPPVPYKQTKASSFVAPTDLQTAPAAATGKRPAGTRLATEPPAFSQMQSPPDTQKAKKGLPFLKNPMSTLLARRKGVQNPPERTPQPQPSFSVETMYDPSIRGTKVHDFSAPRTRRVITTDPPPAQANINTIPATAPSGREREQHRTPAQHPLVVPQRESRDAAAPVLFQNPTPGPMPTPMPATMAPMTTQAPVSVPPQPRPGSNDSQQRSMSFAERQRRISLERKPLPEDHRLMISPQFVPPVPPKDSAPKDANSDTETASTTPAGSTRTASTKSRITSMDQASLLARSNPSLRASMSRNVSLSGMSTKSGVMSAIPRHMKSTSSRFSFDMIGAAKQEKLLEERHRQRAALEKQTEPGTAGRDSRYDDLDDFDYDAMMDDGGLEERIPGVNADAEDDDFYYGQEEEIPMVGDDDYGDEEGFEEAAAEDDPDNDQENFSGFVFQRSNPASSLTSPRTPGDLLTPRDDAGRVIGFAMTKDTSTPDMGQLSQPSPIHVAPEPDPVVDTSLPVAGLGIDTALHLHPQRDALPQRQSVPRQDELYYDGGLNDEFAADELDLGRGGADESEGDGMPFDESIFDADDTDQYGRPIPGAFAEAQARRAAERREAAKRESDLTSRLSAQSMLSQSTAHTSISIGARGPTPAEHQTEAPAQKDSGEAEAASGREHGGIRRSVDGLEDAADNESLATTTASTITARAPDELSGENLQRLSGEIEKLMHMSSQDILYQAALAKATHMAAASGKFRRNSSPPPAPADLVITSPTTASDPPLSSRSVPHGAAADPSSSSNPLEDYENDDDNYFYDDGPFTQTIEDDYDYDPDYDGIVAEANASALANDSDGFYGQEFGFYAGSSLPSGAANGHHHHGNGSSSSHNGGYSGGGSSGSGGGSAALSAQNLFEYSSGGYFGPSGGLIGRSMSGRGVVSREPNLTPITERSEYSNRNSIMSLGLPSATFGGLPGDRGSGALQSPGLAQLAMMADDGDMTLSALMRLRSKAWGGSQASLISSSREGSPRSDLAAIGGGVEGSGASGGAGGAPAASGPPASPWMIPPFIGGGHHTRKGSAFSVLSRDSDAGSGAASPTLTMNMTFPSSMGGPSPSALPPSFAASAAVLSPPPPTAGSSSSNLNLNQSMAVLSPSPSPLPLAIIPSPCSPVPEDNTPTDTTNRGTVDTSGSGAGAAWMSRSRSEEAAAGLYSAGGNNIGAFKANATVAVDGGTPFQAPPQPPQPVASPPPPPVPPMSSRRPGMGHRKRGSSGSISYVREEGEEGGEARWVVERRRPVEGGEVFLDREVVEGRRI